MVALELVPLPRRIEVGFLVRSSQPLHLTPNGARFVRAICADERRRWPLGPTLSVAMAVENIEDYALLEKFALAFLEEMATAVFAVLDESGAAGAEEQGRSAVEGILWTVAAHLDGHHFANLDDGRQVQSSLGFIAVGGRSAFDTAFVEHEGVLTASRIALHEYVHQAIERAVGRQHDAPRKGQARPTN
jgi:hypothetical protein